MTPPIALELFLSGTTLVLVAPLNVVFHRSPSPLVVAMNLVNISTLKQKEKKTLALKLMALDFGFPPTRFIVSTNWISSD
jgi:hypothetical protein